MTGGVQLEFPRDRILHSIMYKNTHTHSQPNHTPRIILFHNIIRRSGEKNVTFAYTNTSSRSDLLVALRHAIPVNRHLYW